MENSHILKCKNEYYILNVPVPPFNGLVTLNLALQMYNLIDHESPK